MKFISSFLSLAMASVLTFCLAPTAEAKPKYGGHGSHGGHSSSGGHSSHGGHSGWSGGNNHRSYGHSSSRYHGPVRLLYTKEIGRRTHYRLARSRTGHSYNQRYTVITYRSTYSNGQTKIYTRTI